MADLDALARSAVGAVTELARKASSLAVGFALFIGAVALITYALGLAALQGSTRSAWAVIGAVLVVIAAGAPLLAAWRLRRIRAHAGALVADVRTLLANNTEAEQIVIETVEVQPTPPGPARRPGGAPALVGQTAQFTRLRRIAGSASNLRELPSTMRAITTFPALLAVAALLMLVMLVLALVFLLAWIF
ncbi:MAG: hypothetical protein ACR2HQ_00350 [Ilumatobacteraceae bacterium]